MPTCVSLAHEWSGVSGWVRSSIVMVFGLDLWFFGDSVMLWSCVVLEYDHLSLLVSSTSIFLSMTTSSFSREHQSTWKADELHEFMSSIVNCESASYLDGGELVLLTQIPIQTLLLEKV